MNLRKHFMDILLSFFKKAGAWARGKLRQPLEKQFIKKTAIQTQLKIFNYYKELNLISEPLRICRAVRRFWGNRMIFLEL